MAYHVYMRGDWGATTPAPGYAMSGPVSEVYIHHFNSGITAVTGAHEGVSRMAGADGYHRSLGWGGIGYSWCVDDIGNLYEGRGWWRTGAHTYGHNSQGYGLCWLGDSNTSTPSGLALASIADCIQLGIAAGAITPNPTIVAHRDRVPDTSCCGDPMYGLLDEIRRLAAGGTPSQGDDDLTPEEHQMLVAIHGTSAGGNFPGWDRPASINDVLFIMDGKMKEVLAAIGTSPGTGGVIDAKALADGITQQVLANLRAKLA